MTLLKNKPLFIDDKFYSSINEAHKKTQIPPNTIKKRINSIFYPNYCWAIIFNSKINGK